MQHTLRDPAYYKAIETNFVATYTILLNALCERLNTYLMRELDSPQI